jgi:hypothetical protein
METPLCLQHGPDCKGKVEYHSYSGRLKAFSRCEFHHAKRVMTEQKINSRYPRQQPRDFNPGDAGESWD